MIKTITHSKSESGVSITLLALPIWIKQFPYTNDREPPAWNDIAAIADHMPVGSINKSEPNSKLKKTCLQLNCWCRMYGWGRLPGGCFGFAGLACPDGSFQAYFQLRRCAHYGFESMWIQRSNMH